MNHAKSAVVLICPPKSRRLIQGLTTILYQTQSF